MSEQAQGERIYMDMTPKGVKEDPARVNCALEAFQGSQTELANYAARVIRDLQDGRISDDEAAKILLDPKAVMLLRTMEDAQEEFLRAVAGQPSRASRASRASHTSCAPKGDL